MSQALLSEIKLQQLVVSEPACNLWGVITYHPHHPFPSLGGCRMQAYQSLADAKKECYDLAFTMEQKARAYDLPVSGGKSVLMKPSGRFNKKLLLQHFARVLETLRGQYICAVDSGTTAEDMQMLGQYTRYTTCKGQGLDPSSYTAMGVERAIKVAARCILKRQSLEGVSILIQGLGKVGFALANLLAQQGARLIVCDINKALVAKVSATLDVQVVAPEAVACSHADIFVPCAFGTLVDHQCLEQLSAGIIISASNNPLDAGLDAKSIWQQYAKYYIPDYLVNGGGLVHCVAQYFSYSKNYIETKIKRVDFLVQEHLKGFSF